MEIGDLQQYGFVIECDGTGAGQHVLPCEKVPWLGLPNAGSAQLLMDDDGPQLTSLGERASLSFEVVRHGFESHLAMTAAAGPTPRVNGLRAGPVSILKVKDQVQIGSDCVLHVSVLHNPNIGSADATEVGAECLVCRTPIVAGQTVFRCTGCGAALHCGGPDRPEHDRLECAVATSVCPRCRQALIREEGYEYVPDL